MKESDLGQKYYIQKLEEEGRRGTWCVRDDEREGEQRGVDFEDRWQP